MNPGERAQAAPWAIVPWAIITALLLVVLWIAVSWQRATIAQGFDAAFTSALSLDTQILATATEHGDSSWITSAGGPHRRVTLFAADGHVLADSAGDPAAVAPADRCPEVVTAQGGSVGYDRRGGDGDSALVL